MPLPPEYLHRLAAIIRRKAPRAKVDEARLGQQIEAVLAAAAIPRDDGAFSNAFREAVDALPTDKEMADQLRKIAAADNPLAPDICSSSALAQLNLRSTIVWVKRKRAFFQNGSRNLLNTSWAEFLDWERDIIRAVASDLAEEHEENVRLGAPRKANFNGLLINLADIFLRETKQRIGRYELEYSPDSVFIKFVEAVLAPFVDTTLGSRKALSNRWDRLKRHSKRKLKPFKPGQKSIRKRPNPRK